LRVLLVHDDADLVAAAALHVGRRGPVRLLLPVGAGVSDFCDVLLSDAMAGEVRAMVIDRMIASLYSLDDWDVMDFPEVRPGSCVGALAARWRGLEASTDASICLELPVEGGMADLLRRLPGSTAKHLRRKLRRIDEVGLDVRLVPPEGVAEALDDFFRLHAEQWVGRGVTAEHMRPRFADFLRRALPLMVEREQAVVPVYVLNGVLVGVRINVVGGQMMGAYLSGTSPALRERIDVATFMLRGNLALAADRGVAVLSLLRGREDYKLRWRPDTVHNNRLLLARRTAPRGLGHVAVVCAWARVRPWLMQRAPWLKRLRVSLRRFGH